VISAIPCRRPGVALSSHVRALAGDLRFAAILSAMNVAFLGDQACVMSDAIGRTLWRLFVNRRHLLEWTPTAQSLAQKRLDLPGFFVRMSGAVVVAAATLLAALLSRQGAWPLAAAFAGLWALSPALARTVSLPGGLQSRARATSAQAQSLRQTARRTWRFFEAFVTREDNWLPPDNFQEDPAPALAHRTSPTNLGLYLLSVVSARDFGWIGAIQAILGRQRQSGGPPHRDRQRLPGVAAIAHRRCIAPGGNLRYAGAGCRAIRPPSLWATDPDGNDAPDRRVPRIAVPDA